MQHQTLGEGLYKTINKETITKEDIIKYHSIISGHYADLDYVDKLIIDTMVDYEDDTQFGKYIISSEPEYRQKLGRLITFEETCIYGPVKKKKK